MLLRDEQMKHLSNGVHEDSFVFNNADDVSDAERQSLIDMDSFWLKIEGYHVIDNYQDLYKTAPTAALKAVAV